MISIGVVLCTYNGSAFLKQQLDSLLSQTWLPDKVWIIDDDSDDDSFEILKQFKAEATFEVCLKRNIKNWGPGNNFLKAIDEVNCDWTLFCDQDDIWMEDKIHSIIKHIGNNPEIELWIHDCNLVDELGNEIDNSFFAKIGLTNFPEISKNPFIELLRRPIGLGMSMAIKTSLAQKAHKPSFKLLHDEWLCWYSAVHSKIGFIELKLASYRLHSGQFTRPSALSFKEKLFNLISYKNSIESHILRVFRLKRSFENWSFEKEDLNLTNYLEHLKVRVRLNLLDLKSYKNLFKEYNNKNFHRFGAGINSFIKDILSSFLKMKNRDKKSEISFLILSDKKLHTEVYNKSLKFASAIALKGFDIKLFLPLSSFKKKYNDFALTYKSHSEFNEFRVENIGLYACRIEFFMDIFRINLSNLGSTILVVIGDHLGVESMDSKLAAYLNQNSNTHIFCTSMKLYTLISQVHKNKVTLFNLDNNNWDFITETQIFNLLSVID